MAKRPIIDKQVRRMRKALRQTPTPYLDLFQWLKLQGHAQTTGEARRIILAGRVKSESHTIGLVELPTIHGPKNFIERLQPAKLRNTIRVEDAK